MNEVVIIQDHNGYTERVRAMQAAHPNVVAASPWTHPHPHTRGFRPPDTWLSEDPSMPIRKKCHYKADAMGLAAVQALGIRADYYWFIESDVVASQARWKAFFADQRNSTADCLCPSLRNRRNHKASIWWKDPHTPDWAEHYFIMACYRLSHRAVVESIRCAEEMRNTFAEVTIPNIILRMGGTFGGTNDRMTHSNVSTFKTHEHKVILNPDLINHPVKSNTFDVPSRPGTHRNFR